MNDKERFALSALLESISCQDFPISLYSRQHRRDPFANVPFSPLYYVMAEAYFLNSSPSNFVDLLGIVEIDIEHKLPFMDASRKLNPSGAPVPFS